MAVAVADSRKRGFTSLLDDTMRFLDDPHPLPSQQAKRGRCSPFAAAAATPAELGVSLEFDPVEALQLIFPDVDPQILKNYFEASGNVLDAAIRGFKDCLASGSTEPGFATDASDGGRKSRNDCTEAVYDSSEMIPSNVSEWADLLVNQVSSSSDFDVAKDRAFSILELFEKSTVQCSSPAEINKMREDHKVLKLMLGGLLEQNGVLKRAFLIQHNRLNHYEKMSEERFQMKQIIEKYEEQIKALKHRNYTLEFHLAQAKQHGSISGRCNPDIF